MSSTSTGRDAFLPIATALGSLLVVGVGLYEARVGSLVGAAALVPLLPVLLPLAGFAPDAVGHLQHPFDAWTAAGCMLLCCAWLYGWLWRVLGTSRERRVRLVWVALAAWGGALAASRANWLVSFVDPLDPLARLLAYFNASMVAMLGGMGDLGEPGWLSASIAGLAAAGVLALRALVCRATGPDPDPRALLAFRLLVLVGASFVSLSLWSGALDQGIRWGLLAGDDAAVIAFGIALVMLGPFYTLLLTRPGVFLPAEAPFRVGRFELSGWRVWLGSLVALAVVELMLVVAWLLRFPMTWGYDQTFAEAAGLLVVAASTLLPPTIVVVAALHERGPPASPGGWALWPCAWCWATLVSIMAGVLTDFYLPTMTGAAFALVLPFYIVDRIWLERRRRDLWRRGVS